MNYLLTESVVFTRKSQPNTLPFELAIARSIRQDRSLKFLRKDRTCKINKLFVIWLFALFFFRPIIGPRAYALRENNALELASQRARYIGYELALSIIDCRISL